MIVVYSTKTCPKCKALKRHLKKMKIEFIEKNLEDTEVMSNLVMKNIFIQSAPAIQIGNQIYTYIGDSS